MAPSKKVGPEKLKAWELIGGTGPHVEVSEAMYWVLRLSQVCGAAPVRFQRLRGSSRRTVQMAPGLPFVGYTAVTLCSIVGNCISLRDVHYEMKISSFPLSLTKWIVITNFLFVTMTASVAVYGSRRRLGVILLCMGCIQKIRGALSNEYTSRSISMEKKKRIVFVFLFAHVASTCAYSFFVAMQVAVKTTVKRICFSAITLMSFCMMMQFVLTATVVYNTLQAINETLEQTLYPWAANKRRSGQFFVATIVQRPKRVEKLVHELSTMYGSVCDAVLRLDGSCGLGVMLLLISCCIMLTSMMYFTIMDFSSRDFAWTAETLNSCLLQFTWLVAMIEPCHMTQVEAARTRVLISQLSVRYTDELARAALHTFSRGLLLNRVEYYPMGMCCLTRSLMATMIANVSTYFVIIIQFPSSPR